MKKRADKAKTGRKRVSVKDLAAKNGGAKGGAKGLLLPAVHKVQKVRLTDITDGTSNTLLRG